MCNVTWDMWHVTCDMWHVTFDMWHVTRDMWHMEGGEQSLKLPGPLLIRFWSEGVLKIWRKWIHLCFNITEKGQMLVPNCYNSILDNTKTYCLLGDFMLFVANLTCWDFPKWPKTCYFWIRESGWEWLTTAAQNQKWLMKTRISVRGGLAAKRLDI